MTLSRGDDRSESSPAAVSFPAAPFDCMVLTFPLAFPAWWFASHPFSSLHRHDRASIGDLPPTGCLGRSWFSCLFDLRPRFLGYLYFSIPRVAHHHAAGAEV